MRSRWLHKPILHIADAGVEKKATWLELFYDLIFVAAFIQLGNGLSANTDLRGAATFGGVFVPLWVAWSGFTFFQNRFTLDDFTHRLTVFAQMFAVAGMAIGAPGVLAGEFGPFSASASVAFLLVAVMYARAYHSVEEGREYSRYWGLAFAAAGILWGVGAVVSSGVSLALGVVGTMLVLLMPLAPQSRKLGQEFPIDFEHLGERYALLTLIVLGESFVKVLGVLSVESAGWTLYLDGCIALLITCSIWWVYFDDVAGATIRKGPFSWIVWLYAHIFLQIGVTATGIGVKKAVYFPADAAAPDAYRWLLAGSLALVLLAVATIDSVTERRQAELSDRVRVMARGTTGALLLVLAPAGASMSGSVFLILVTTLMVAQVVFDMLVAPFVEDGLYEAGSLSLKEIAKADDTKASRRDVSEAVRKGTPSNLRRDFYFYLIEGSWLRVFFVSTAVFVLTNIFFAGLYVLSPGAIANARADSFLDAFFFSVQTMSTIGYGALSPSSTYGNMVVTLQAAASILGTAVITGLVFAKVSRPKASVLFSDKLVLTTMHGERYLMFRVGNVRGSEVADATVHFTALVDEVSPEGHHLRRMYPLKLERERTPLFVLTWTVMHKIEEDSPIAGLDLSGADSKVIGFFATIIGHDSTYAQTIHDRHAYFPEDVGIDEAFVDVMSQLPDGRLMIDYDRFHDTTPLAAVSKTT